MKTPGIPFECACKSEKFDGRTNDTLFIEAVNRVPFKPWHRLLGKFLGHLSRPKPMVKNKFSSIVLGTTTFRRDLNFRENDVTVFVWLKAGKGGMIGVEVFVVLLYWRTAVVVVLSNGAFWALW